MAKVRKNAVLQELSGSVGNLVFRQMADGSTRVCKKPDFSKRKFSQGQKDHQSRFKQAVAYAREAAGTQPIYAELASGTMKNAYNVALSDWLHPPVIQRIERKKGRVRVTAVDNVLVAEVQVKVMDQDGNVLEQGQATQPNLARHPEWWEYPSSAEGTIEATAWDLAGNQTVVVAAPSA